MSMEQWCNDTHREKLKY